MENNTEKQRKALRHQILANFPGMSASQIFEEIREEKLPIVKMSNLAPFCEKIGIQIKQLPLILGSYSVNGKSITAEKFQKFLEDELCFNTTTNFKPKEIETIELPVKQWEILNAFVGIFKEKKASFGYSPNSRSFAPKEGYVKTRKIEVTSDCNGCNNHWLWIQAKSLNSFEYDNSSVRLAALCKFAEEVNLQFSTEEFIEAVFAFLGERTDHLTYEQFSKLMNSFP